MILNPITGRVSDRFVTAHAAQVRDFRFLVITFGLQALAIGGLLDGVDYVARTVLDQPSASSILFACFSAPRCR